MTLQELIEKRAKAYDAAKGFRAEMEKAFEAKDEARAKELEASFDKAMAEFDSLYQRIKQQEELEKRGKELDRVEKPVAATHQDGPAGRKEDLEARNRAFNAFLRTSPNRWSEEERSVIHQMQSNPLISNDPELRAWSSMGVAWVFTPSAADLAQHRQEKRDLSTGAGGTGGFTVGDDTSFIGALVESRQAFGGMRQAPTMKITTATGADLPIPANDDTGNTGEIIAEGAAHNVQDTAFTQVVLQAFLYSSKILKTSVQMLQDSAIDVPGFVGRILGTRIGRITNTHFTTGDGASKPRGVVTASGLGVTAASATAITADEVIDLLHSVDPAYRVPGETAWMFNDSTLKAVRKLKGSDNNYLWQPGLAVGEPSTLLAFPYIINQDMANIATTNKSMLFGNFSHYWIRDVQGVILLRLNELYAANLQVGFLAFSRADGDLVDPGDDPIKHLIQA